MRSTTAMVFAPGCRWTFTITAGVVFIHAAWCTSSTPSTTSATSESRTGAPSLIGDDERAVGGAGDELIVGADGVRLLRPVERAFRLIGVGGRQSPASSCVRLSPYAASAVGFACTRTAGFCPPLIVTRPTPASCEIFGASRVSASDCTSLSGSTSEVSASVSTGASAGFTLL